MDQPLWGRRPLPQPGPEVVARWESRPSTPAELTALRRKLRDALLDGSRPGWTDGDVERLLLVFEELASNGLRHGRPPVQVTVTTTGTHWLLDVADGAADHLPTPAVDRDAADGGLGLYLVARLSAAHGWTVEQDRKHVWATVPCTTPVEDVVPWPRAGTADPDRCSQ